MKHVPLQFQLGVSSTNVDILKSALDSANIDDCNVLHPNQTKLIALITTPSTTTPYDPCVSNPCVHGMCQSTDSYDEYSCTCEYGYVGRNCENILKQCELLLPCRNGGSCTDLRGSYKCDCPLRYNGQNCEKRNYEETSKLTVAMEYPLTWTLSLIRRSRNNVRRCIQRGRMARTGQVRDDPRRRTRSFRLRDFN